MLIPIALLAGVGLLIALGSSKKEGSGGGPLAHLQMPKDAEAELRKLQSENGQAASTILGLFQNPPPPVIIPALLVQYGLSVFGKYPALSTFLVQRAKDIMTQTTGKSGTVWNTWSNGLSQPDGTLMTHVLLDATPVLTFSQKGNDQSSRKSIAEHPLPMGLPPDTMAKAHADFV